jgi:ABC-type antimicrobial peptide transport system permease subunit
MSEWHLVSVLVALVIGFILGLVYALRLYKQIEAAIR